MSKERTPIEREKFVSKVKDRIKSYELLIDEEELYEWADQGFPHGKFNECNVSYDIALLKMYKVTKEEILDLFY